MHRVLTVGNTRATIIRGADDPLPLVPASGKRAGERHETFETAVVLFSIRSRPVLSFTEADDTATRFRDAGTKVYAPRRAALLRATTIGESRAARRNAPGPEGVTALSVARATDDRPEKVNALSRQSAAAAQRCRARARRTGAALLPTCRAP